MTNSPSVGDVAESSRSTSRSRTRSNVQDVKPSTNISDALKDLLANPNKLRQGDCYVGQILLDFEPTTSQLFKTALDDKRIRHVDLLKLVEAEGYKMSEATMRRHRSGACRCPR